MENLDWVVWGRGTTRYIVGATRLFYLVGDAALGKPSAGWRIRIYSARQSTQQFSTSRALDIGMSRRPTSRPEDDVSSAGRKESSSLKSDTGAAHRLTPKYTISMAHMGVGGNHIFAFYRSPIPERSVLKVADAYPPPAPWTESSRTHRCRHEHINQPLSWMSP